MNEYRSPLLDEFCRTTENKIIKRLLPVFAESIDSDEEEQTTRLTEELVKILEEVKNEAAQP